MFHRELHEQMYSELRWTPKEAEETADGIDVRSLELPTPAIGLLKMMRSYEFVKDCIPGFLIELFSKQLVNQSSHVCILTMPRPPKPSAFVDAGRVLERVWLKAEEMNLALQPWMVLPYFVIRVEYFGGEGFNGREKKELRMFDTQLRKLFSIPDEHCPCFIFRLSEAKAPSVRTFRLPWNRYTELV